MTVKADNLPSGPLAGKVHPEGSTPPTSFSIEIPRDGGSSLIIDCNTDVNYEVSQRYEVMTADNTGIGCPKTCSVFAQRFTAQHQVLALQQASGARSRSCGRCVGCRTKESVQMSLQETAY